MKKHWFLVVVVGTLISFTSCKKENYEEMILGEWELIEVEGDIWIEENISNHTITYIFLKETLIYMVDGITIDSRGNHKYYIQKSKLYFDNGSYVEISFSGAKKMIWIDEYRKLTFKKIS